MSTRDVPTTCPICGGPLEETTVTHDETWGDQTYRFVGVPAFKCTECGEVLFSAEVNGILENVIQQRDEPDHYEEVRVPVFSFDQHRGEAATT